MPSIEEIKRLIEAATPGPWHSVRAAMKDSFVPCRARVVAHDKAQENPELLVEVPSYSHRPEHDAAFIAASRTLMPKLLAVAEAAKLLKRSGPCDGNRRTCECGPCQLDRALHNLEGDQ